MINTFYFLSILFIFNFIFYIFNRKALDVRFKKRDSHPKLHLVYYFIKILFAIWIGVGLFGDLNLYFIILLGLSILKFIIFHINKKLYYYYYLSLPFLNIATLGVLLTVFLNAKFL